MKHQRRSSCISSVQPMILYGTCVYIGKIKKDDLESRQDSASIVLTPRVSEPFVCLELLLLTTYQIVFRLQRDTSQREPELLRAICLLPMREWQKATSAKH